MLLWSRSAFCPLLSNQRSPNRVIRYPIRTSVTLDFSAAARFESDGLINGEILGRSNRSRAKRSSRKSKVVMRPDCFIFDGSVAASPPLVGGREIPDGRSCVARSARFVVCFCPPPHYPKPLLSSPSSMFHFQTIFMLNLLLKIQIKLFYQWRSA